MFIWKNVVSIKDEENKEKKKNFSYFGHYSILGSEILKRDEHPAM